MLVLTAICFVASTVGEPPVAPTVGDEETAVHIVLAAELGGSGFVQLASSTAILPALHVRPFLALSLGRFAFQVEGALESIAVIVLGITSSIAALYAIEASESSRLEVGVGAGARAIAFSRNAKVQWT